MTERQRKKGVEKMPEDKADETSKTKRKAGRPRKSSAKPKEKRRPGRPPEYGTNELPKCCRFCGSTRTKRYGQKDYGAPPNIRRVRYRECQDCKEAGRSVYRYTSTEFLESAE